LLDTVLDEETGIFFGEQSADALVDAVDRFQHWQAHFDPVDAVMNARRFAPDMFDRGFMRKVIELRPDLSFEMPAAMEDAHLPLVIPRPEAQMAVPFAA
jgi:hypothetical protein